MADARNLCAEGWTRQNVASEPRLSEAVETYESLGFEVLLVPVLQECASEGEAGRCTACFGADENPDRYQVIYTRRRASAAGRGEEPSDA
ncbi:MAG: hypothetical protein HZB55_21760 [Deltaproteobacteria bacterium]|nr:hypothetical protein [Deltaproteobacteria bacterium]